MRRLAFVFGLILAVSLRADTLVLDDGTRVEGKAHKDGEQWVVIDASGHETDVPAERIVEFDIGGPASGESADDRLASLRDSVKGLSDLPTIIDRYNAFINSSPDSDAAKQAQGDLAQWQAKLDGHYVKVGDRWLTPAEHAALVAGEADAANRIGLLIESDQYQDASDALTQALAADPQDPAALYLHGVVLADQGQTLAAREEFQKVAKIIPHHVPTLNNLGVLFSKQQAYPIALASYMAAMKLRPDDLLILNNVAEALHAVPTEQQQSPVVVDATKMFQEQDKRLQQEQAEKGLYRWGATWVSKQQLDDLQAQQQQIEGQMALLQSDYQNTISQINSDNMAITEDQQNVQAYQQQYSFSTMSPPVRGRGGFGYTNSSFGINNSYTGQNYASNQADLNRATADKQTQMQHLADLRTRAAQLQQTLSVPPFSGLQHLIGPEGTPIQTSPATQPAAP